MGASFFKFPVSLLGQIDSAQISLQRIVSYCLVTEGERKLKHMAENEVEEMIETCRADSSLSYDFDNSRQSRVVNIGHSLLNVSGGSYKSTYSGHREALQIITSFAPTGEAAPLVFISTQLLWGCHDGNGLAWREFRVLCAVNSILGMKDRPPVIVVQDLIGARACGFSTPAAMRNSTLPENRIPLPLTRSELRTSLDRLERGEFFTRVSPSPRRTFFSKSLDHAAVRASVRTMIERRAVLSRKRELDRALNLSLSARRP